MRTPQPARPQQRGFTLVEAAVSTLIVAVMVSAAISVVGGAARGASRERDWRRGQSLAASLMAEVLATSFADPQGGSAFGIDTGETAMNRTTYDDVDDYNGYTEAGATDVLGSKIPWADGWTRSVIVENVTIADPSVVVSDSTNTGLRRVTVTVTSPSLEARTLVALKARDSVIDAYTPQVGENRVTGVRISLRVGRTGSVLVGGASLFNSPSATIAAAP